MKQNEKKQFRSVSILFFVVFWVFFVHLRRPLAVQSTYKRLVRASVSSFVSSSAFCFEQIGCVFLFVISFVATVFKFVLLVSSSSSSVCVSGVAFSFCWLIRFGNAPGKGQKNGARLSLRDRCVCVCVERAGNICWEKNGWANGNQTTNTNETWAITIEWIETEGAEKKWGGGVFFIEDVLEADSTAVVGRRWTLETQKQWQRLRRRIIGCATGPDWGRTTAAASWCAPVRWWWSWCSRTGRCSAGSSDGPPPPAFHLIRRQNNKQTVKNILYGVSKLAQ